MIFKNKDVEIDRIKGYSSALLLCITNSFYTVFSKLLLKELDPLLLGFVNSAIGALFLFSLVLFKNEFQKVKRARRKLTLLVLIGLIGSSYNLSVLIGLKYSSAINGGILLRADIMFSVIRFNASYPPFCDDYKLCGFSGEDKFGADMWYGFNDNRRISYIIQPIKGFWA